jgi:hypothetical protein
MDETLRRCTDRRGPGAEDSLSRTMAPRGPAGGDGDAPRRVLAFIRSVAPFAYCDACLALRLDIGLGQMTALLAELSGDNGATLDRVRRACYGCSRTLELSALREGPPR